MSHDHNILLQSMRDLKAAQMNVQNSLIQELIFYKFELGYNTMEATKDICFVKSEDEVDHRTVTKWSKNFHSGCKNLDNQAKLCRPKTGF